LLLSGIASAVLPLLLVRQILLPAPANGERPRDCPSSGFSGQRAE